MPVPMNTGIQYLYKWCEITQIYFTRNGYVVIITSCFSWYRLAGLLPKFDWADTVNYVAWMLKFKIQNQSTTYLGKEPPYA